MSLLLRRSTEHTPGSSLNNQIGYTTCVPGLLVLVVELREYSLLLQIALAGSQTEIWVNIKFRIYLKKIWTRRKLELYSELNTHNEMVKWWSTVKRCHRFVLPRASAHVCCCLLSPKSQLRFDFASTPRALCFLMLKGFWQVWDSFVHWSANWSRATYTTTSPSFGHRNTSRHLALCLWLKL